jgi:hypothetical protein
MITIIHWACCIQFTPRSKLGLLLPNFSSISSWSPIPHSHTILGTRRDIWLRTNGARVFIWKEQRHLDASASFFPTGSGQSAPKHIHDMSGVFSAAGANASPESH